MLILLDIGNTSVTCGKVVKRKIQGLQNQDHNDIPKFISLLIKNGGEIQNNIVISSVVPKTTLKIKRYFSSQSNTRIWAAGENLPVPIRHRYKDIQSLGMDRRVCVYGALRLYKPPFLLLDYGTALTADYVDSKGIFHGGMIIPGPELAYQALLQRAALLPKNTRLPQKTPPFLGRSPEECLKSGILQGYGAMAEGLVENFRKKFGKSTQVIATGGFASQIEKVSRCFDLVDAKLCLKSLQILFENQTSLTKASLAVKSSDC